MVRSLDYFLKKEFNIQEGLADPKATLLDPAAGTLTFIETAMRIALEKYIENHGHEGKEQFAREHLLKHFRAIELLPVPYVLGIMRISKLFKEFNIDIRMDDINFQLGDAFEIMKR